MVRRRSPGKCTDYAETDFDGIVLNFVYNLDSAAEVTSDNPQILFLGLAMFYDTQSAVDIYTILADLARVGL